MIIIILAVIAVLCAFLAGVHASAGNKNMAAILVICSIWDILAIGFNVLKLVESATP